MNGGSDLSWNEPNKTSLRVRTAHSTCAVQGHYFNHLHYHDCIYLAAGGVILNEEIPVMVEEKPAWGFFARSTVRIGPAHEIFTVHEACYPTGDSRSAFQSRKTNMCLFGSPQVKSLNCSRTCLQVSEPTKRQKKLKHFHGDRKKLIK